MLCQGARTPPPQHARSSRLACTGALTRACCRHGHLCQVILERVQVPLIPGCLGEGPVWGQFSEGTLGGRCFVLFLEPNCRCFVLLSEPNCRCSYSLARSLTKTRKRHGLADEWTDAPADLRLAHLLPINTRFAK